MFSLIALVLIFFLLPVVFVKIILPLLIIYFIFSFLKNAIQAVVQFFRPKTDLSPKPNGSAKDMIIDVEAEQV